MAERQQTAMVIFVRALALAPDARSAFLDDACAGDEVLRAEVESLIVADEEADDFIATAVRGGTELLDGEAFERTPLPRLRRIGKYAIEREIGAGGFGVVYLGHDTVLKRSVAIKTAKAGDADLRRRFVREAEIAARLAHPNIVTIHDFGEHGEVLYLVQEYLSGEDLKGTIEQGEPLPLATRLDILLQVARGLAYAHDQGVLHRDIKPANVRLLEDGRTKILDFGIARLLDHDTRFTSEGVTLGTVGYLAPEQLQGKEVDRRADIFSFGVLAYELMSGERPFHGEVFSQIAYQVLFGEPTRLGDKVATCPPPLDRLVMKCLHKEPAHRFASCDEVVREIEAITQVRAAAPPPPQPPRRALPWVALAAVVVMIVAGSAGWSLWRQQAVADAVQSASPVQVAAVDTVPGGRHEETVAEQPLPEGSVRDVVPPSPAAAVPASAPPPALPVAEMAPPPSRREPDRSVVPPSSTPISPPAVDRTAEAAEKADEPSPPAPVAEDPVAEAPVVEDPVAEAPVVEDNADDDEDALQAVEDTSSPDESSTSPPSSAPPPAPSPSPPPPTALATPPDASAPQNEVASSPSSMQRGDLIPEGEGIAPQLVSRPEVTYPAEALRQRREADVVIAVLVGENGRVIRALVSSGDDAKLGFNEVALAAARQAIFQPATRDGIPGRMWTRLPFAFRLPASR